MKKQVNKKTIAIILILLITLLTFYFSNLNKDGNGKINGEIKTKDEEIDWKTYTSSEYDFRIDFPSYWDVYEDFEGPSPIINFYQKNPDQNPPFDHFSDNPNVSVFPEGIPTEGVVGSQIEITEEVINENHDLRLRENPERVVSYLLDNNSNWAYMIIFSNVPDAWQDWGFLWSRSRVSNLEEKCFRENEEVSAYECDVFTGDQIVRFGDVNNEITEIQTEMLNSFEFTD